MHNCDADDNTFILFKLIMNQKSPGKSIKKREGYINHKNRAPERRNTTKGWELLVKWSNRIMKWKNLSDIKDSFPAQVTEYALGDIII